MSFKIGDITACNCDHNIAKLTKGWGHLKPSEMQQGPEFDQSKLGVTSNCCTVDGCKCCNPEPKEEEKKGE